MCPLYIMVELQASGSATWLRYWAKLIPGIVFVDVLICGTVNTHQYWWKSSQLEHNDQALEWV